MTETNEEKQQQQQPPLKMPQNPTDELTYWKTILEGQYMGIDFENIQVYIADRNWRIKPTAHIKSSIKKMQHTISLHKEVIESFEKGEITEDQLFESTNHVAKTNLENSLIDFSYDELAEDPDFGPKILADLSGMLRDFLVYVGASPGVRRLQQQSKAATALGSHTSQN